MKAERTQALFLIARWNRRRTHTMVCLRQPRVELIPQSFSRTQC